MKYFILFFLFVYSSIALCQSDTVPHQDTTSWQYLFQKARSFKPKDYPTALLYLKKAKLVATKQKELYYSLSYESHIYIKLNRSDSAKISGRKYLAMSPIVNADSIENVVFDYKAISEIYLMENDYDSTIYFISIADSMCQKHQLREPLYAIYSILGTLYAYQDDYDHAEIYFLKSLASAKEVYLLNNKDKNYSICLNNMTQYYLDLYDLEKAKECNQKSLEITDTTHVEYGMVLCSAARIEERLKKYEDAEKLYIQGLAILAKEGKAFPNYTSYLSNLGGLYRLMNNYHKADSLLTLALKLDIERKVSSKALIKRIKNLAVIKNLGKDYENARKYCFEALVALKENYGENYYETGLMEYEIACHYEDIAKYDSAAIYFKSGLQKVILHLKNNTLLLTEKEKIGLVHYLADTHWNNFKAIVMQHPIPSMLEGLVDFQIESKAFMLYDAQKTSNLIKELNNKEAKLCYDSLLNVKGELSNLSVLSASLQEKQRAHIESLKAQENLFQKRLLAYIPENKITNPSYKCTDILQHLAQNEAYIEIFTYIISDSLEKKHTLYGAVIATPTKALSLVSLGSKEQLTAGYNQYINHVLNGYTDTLAYQLFWQPLAAQLTGIHKVYISADGIYHKINLNSLLSPNKEYVINNWDIHYLYSAKDLLVQNKPIRPINKNIALLGNPNFSLSDSDYHQTYTYLPNITKKDYFIPYRNRGIENTKLRDLGGTEKEVNDIYQLFLNRKNWKPERYLKNNATEEVLKGIKNPDILLIATHSFSGTEPNKDKAYNSQMYQFGLCLSGAQTNK